MAATKHALAAEVWGRIIGFFFGHQDFQDSFRDLGLTPGHMKMLMMLDRDQAQPMRALAERLACDASNVTWMVDRLEERGLVERRNHPGDRRVKAVVLTTEGAQTRARLLERLLEPPTDLVVLTRTQLEALAVCHRALAQCGGAGGGVPQSGLPSVPDRRIRRTHRDVSRGCGALAVWVRGRFVPSEPVFRKVHSGRRNRRPIPAPTPHLADAEGRIGCRSRPWERSRNPRSKSTSSCPRSPSTTCSSRRPSSAGRCPGIFG